MRIKEISLKNFKRFADLTIKDIPESAKLVLLIGANGSGKSSIFDAFEYYNNREQLKEGSYYSRIPSNLEDFSIEFVFDSGTLKTGDIQAPGLYFDTKGYHDNYVRHWIGTGIFDLQKNTYTPAKNVFYGRSSIKIVSRIPSPDLQKSVEKDADRPEFFIDQDIRFNTDIYEYIREINAAIRSPFLKGEKTDASAITREYLTNLNESFKYIFGENKTSIQIIDIVDSIPGVPAKLIFKKGDSEINYDLLSHGEKQIVTLLLNFVIRNKYYKDTIYFIDEMDTHLETSIQKRLIENVVEKWMPEGSQLWTASHALGFIEYANKSDNAAIIDFDNLDFDVPQVLVPSPKDNAEVYEIAVGKEFLPSLFSGFKIYFVENKDKQKYALAGLDKKIFVPENGRNGVYHKVKTGQYLGIVDRDYLSDDDMAEIKKQYIGLVILDYYCIENYLFHPDNLQEYYNTKGKPFDQTNYINHIRELKNGQLKSITLSLSLTRTSYPYFGEPAFNDTPNQNRFKNKGENIAQSKVINEMLSSDDFNQFYKVFSMKKAGLEELANIHSDDLAQTNWFKTKMKALLV
jgi:AAA15 family ATPase/GTPase